MDQYYRILVLLIRTKVNLDWNENEIKECYSVCYIRYSTQSGIVGWSIVCLRHQQADEKSRNDLFPTTQCL
jgi:hypothetical protein